MNVLRSLLIFLGILATLLGFAVGDGEPPLVKVLQGTIRGSMKETVSGRKVASFQGIPYAEPPVGDLRFRAPIPSKGWEGIWDGTKERDPCIQMDYIFDPSARVSGKEDCLYLNVYVPLEILEKVNSSAIQGEESQKVPVMIFIHGGGWLAGSGSAENYGPDLLLDDDVILVTLNYRLSAFGFLSTGDKASPGNYGLKDQTMCMKWVNENIAAFGGDNGRVTIFGQSAGGASVHYHILSPLSQGLFQNGISHSGVALNSWAFARGAPTIAKTLASYVNCSNDNSEEMVNCLRTKDAAEVANQFGRFIKWSIDPMMIFSPTIEREDQDEPPFITEHPYKLMKTGKFNQVNWIAGATREDGSFKAASILTSDELTRELNEDYDTVGPITTRVEETAEDPKETAQKIRHFYFGDADIGVETHENLTNLYNDRHTYNGVVKSFNAMTEANPSFNAYFYIFSYKGKYSLGDLIPVINKTSNSTVDMGVVHCDDLYFLFPMNEFVMGPHNLTGDDSQMSRIMRKLWVSFAENGNPNSPPSSLIPVNWDTVKPNELNLLEIGGAADGLKMKPYPQEHLNRNEFWESLQLSEDQNYKEQNETD